MLASDTTRQRPLLLILLLMLLVIDIFVLAIRLVVRRRARGEGAEPAVFCVTEQTGVPSVP